MAKVYVGLGTNLGDKEQNLRDAVQKIEEQIGKVISLSAFYVTAPWGFASENSFLNAAACVETDLLLYEDLVLSVTSPSGAELNLPHPLMTERDFVMLPLAEIAPELVHPVLGKTMKEISSGMKKRLD